MRVLWFSNTPANSAEHLKEGPLGGGWLKSLDKELQSKVELHIAFYYPKCNQAFTYLDTTYHPIVTKNWKFKALLGLIWRRFINNQDLPLYLSIINRVRPDIIHIQGTENPYGCIIPHTEIPVVVSIQGCITVYNHKFQNGFTKNNLRLSYSFRGKTFRQIIRSRTFMRFWSEFKKMKTREQVNLKNTKYIIGRTAWDRRITSVLAPQSLYYHGDEMLRTVFYERIWQYSKKEKIIVFSTSANSPFKGFETICEALFELNNMPDIKIEWHIAGVSIHDSIVKITRRKLKRRFPENGLQLLGPVTEQELAKKLCQSDIYVSASHIENSPNSLCEAMILGMPCIATFSGGSGSLLKDGEDGILVQDGDPWVMAGAIIELYRNPGLAFQYGQNARKKAEMRHNKEKIITELLNTYRDIISQ